MLVPPLVWRSNWSVFNLWCLCAANEKICCRCGKRFIVYADGSYARSEQCIHHWGKAWKKRGQWDDYFSCVFLICSVFCKFFQFICPVWQVALSRLKNPAILFSLPINSLILFTLAHISFKQTPMVHRLLSWWLKRPADKKHVRWWQARLIDWILLQIFLHYNTHW